MCPTCNTSNDTDATFCKHCGASLTEAAPAAGGGFSLVLNDPGHNKINVIKVVRELMNSSLLDAKTIVDMQGGALHHGLPEELANKLAEKLRAAGADVTVTRTGPGDQAPFRVNATKSVKVSFKTNFPTNKSADPSAFNTPDGFNAPGPTQGQTSFGPVLALLVMIGLAVAGYFVYMAMAHPGK